MARQGTSRRLERDGACRQVSARRPAGGVAHGDSQRLYRTGRGRRPRLPHRFPAHHRQQGHRACGRHRRADREDPLDQGVGNRLHGTATGVCHRAARHANRGRRPGLRARDDGAALRVGCADGPRAVAEGLRQGLRRRRPVMGDGRCSTGRWRPADRARRRRTERQGDGVRQADRKRNLAGALVGLGAWIRVADDHRGRRRAAAHHLRATGHQLARSGDRQGVPDRPARGRDGHDGTHARAKRPLSHRDVAVWRRAHDEARRDQARRDAAVDGPRRQRPRDDATTPSTR